MIFDLFRPSKINMFAPSPNTRAGFRRKARKNILRILISGQDLDEKQVKTSLGNPRLIIGKEPNNKRHVLQAHRFPTAKL